MLGCAIVSVKAGDWASAQEAVSWVDLTSLAQFLDREAFLVEQLHHDPRASRGGGRGQLSEPLDLFSVYRALGKAARGGPAESDSWLVELRAVKAYEVGVYRVRVDEIVAKLDAMAVELEAAAACWGPRP